MYCCSGYILCDIPSHGDVALEIFGDRPPQPPQQSSKSNTPAAAVEAVSGSAGSSKSRGGGSEGLGRSSSPPTTISPVAGAAADAQSGVAVGEFQPTHVVYLNASLEYIVAQQGLREAGAEGGGGGKEAEAKLRADLDRYFAEEQQHSPPEMKGDGSTSTENAPLREKQRRSTNGPGNEKQNAAGEEAGVDGNGDGSREEERWIPATARALQDRYAIEAEAIDGEGGEEGDGSGVVSAVDELLCGGEVPTFVWMLSGGDVDVAVEEGESSAEEKTQRQANGGRGGIVGEEDSEGAGRV